MTGASPAPDGDAAGAAIDFVALPEGFDLLAATPEDLESRSLPPCPDPRQVPIAFANWVRALASRPKFPRMTAAPANKIVIQTNTNKNISQASSRNWSGVFVRPRWSDGMALVQGRWIVPDTPPHRSGLGTASSVWVGLDGYDPASRLIPQIGTAQIPPDISVEPFPNDQFAWWQLWTPDPKSRLERIPITIRRNDMIYAQVHVLDQTRVCYFLKNETTNKAFCKYYRLPSGFAYGPFERRTAEWIVERPMTPEGKESSVLIWRPLTDYGETAFTDCNAATMRPDGTLSELQLQRGRLIRMNAWDDRAIPGRLVSKAERVGNDAVRMSYAAP